jgi:hypothetical protein
MQSRVVRDIIFDFNDQARRRQWREYGVCPEKTFRLIEPQNVG